MNGQVELTCRTLQAIAHSIMLNARVYDEYINFAFMYMTGHIFPVLSIKHLVKQYGEPTRTQKMATEMKLSVSNPLFIFPCVSQKATAHFDTKALNMRHQSPKKVVSSL